MDDLIRREDAIDAVHKTVGKFIPILMVSEENVLLDCVTAINQLPSAQKKGRWVRDEHGVIFCSECGGIVARKGENGFLVYAEEPPKFKYCPHCGADMRGDECK